MEFCCSEGSGDSSDASPEEILPSNVAHGKRSGPLLVKFISLPNVTRQLEELFPTKGNLWPQVVVFHFNG